MFRDENQRNRVCLAVLGPHMQGKGVWDEMGPTEIGVQYAESNGGPLSTGERILVAVAFAVYNGGGAWSSISDLVSRLDDDNLRRIGGMLVALTGDNSELERWLADQASSR